MNRLRLWCVFAVVLQRAVTGQQLVSQGKPITSSSQHKTLSADKAVDGNKTQSPNECNCCAATNPDHEPWYKLDLEQTHMVQSINVIGGLRYHNLSEMEIKLGTSSEGGTVLTKNTVDVFTYDYTLPTPHLGRYVTLTLSNTTQYFVICELELEVYADCSGNTYGDPCVPCGNCLNGDPCNETDGLCQACEPGYQGTKCDQPCEVLTYGPNCISNCGKCLNNATCDNKDGRCDSCAAGYKGDKCLETCDRFTYGVDCKESCGRCANNLPCNRVDGSCPNGCHPGFKGELCKEECGVNTYGNSCIPCGHCLNDTQCDKQEGTCGSCAAGYTGNKCVEECEDGTYGEGCTSICGNCHGDEICNKQNGTCQACECGYTVEINPAATRSDCPNIALLVGGTLVSILAIEGVAAAIFFLIRKRRRSLKKDAINRSNPYELPNRGINEGEHEYEAAMELDDDTNAYENTGLNITVRREEKPPSDMNRIRDFKSFAFMKNVWSTSI